MALRIYSIFLFFLISLSIGAQDVVIHSKKSDEAMQQLKELISAIEDKDLLKSFSDKEIKILTEVSSALDGKTFPVPENFKSDAESIKSTIQEALNDEGRKIPQAEKAEKVDPLIEAKLTELKTKLDEHAAKAMKGIIDSVQLLQKESDANNAELNTLLKAEAKDVDKMVQKLLN